MLPPRTSLIGKFLRRDRKRQTRPDDTSSVTKPGDESIVGKEHDQVDLQQTDKQTNKQQEEQQREMRPKRSIANATPNLKLDFERARCQRRRREEAREHLPRTRGRTTRR